MVSQKLVETLFNGGNSHSVAVFPLRAVYAKTNRQEDDAPVQLLISVAKKRFHHAVDRNRVKRQIREAYRHHKDILYAALPATEQLLLAYVWLADRHMSSAEVESRIVKLMQRIAEKL